jgi:hypothetical protein
MLTLVSDYDYETETDRDDFNSPTSQALQNFQDFSERRLPALVESRLETIVQNTLHPLEDELKSTVGDMVRNLVSELFQTWKQSICDIPGSKDSGTIQNQEASHDPSPNRVVPEERGRDDYIAPFFIEPSHTAFPVDTIDDAEKGLQPKASQDISDSGYGSLKPLHCLCNTSQNAFEGFDTQLQGSAMGLSSIYQSCEVQNTSYSNASNTNFEATIGHSSSRDESFYATSTITDGKGAASLSIDPSYNFCNNCLGVL